MMDIAGTAGKVVNSHQRLGISLTLSMICHLLFFGAFIYLPDSGHRGVFPYDVIDVSIVALPSFEAKTASATAPAAKGASKAVSAPEKAAKAAAATAEFKQKTSLKKKTFSPSRAMKHAISRIEQQVDASKSRTLDDLRKRVEDAEKSAELDSRLPSSGSGSKSRQAFEVMDVYMAEIKYHIQRNWVYSEQLAGGRSDLMASLVIEIKSDGSIRDIWFEKRSGNRYVDEQAYKAIKKSDPLPPLPKGYSRPVFNVGLRFTPSGLK